MEERSETSRDAIGVFGIDRTMQRRYPISGLSDRRIVTVYGARGRLCVKQVSEKRAGRESLADDSRPDQTRPVIMAHLIDKVDDLVCAQWVSKQLTYQHKKLRNQHFNICFGIMQTPGNFPGADCHRSKLWRQQARCCSPSFSTSKVGHLFNSSSTEELSTPYCPFRCEILRRICRSIKNKRPGLFTDGVVLHHDNARPHVSRVTHAELAKFKWEQLDHPPYSSDRSPCDFHVFCPLKNISKGSVSTRTVNSRML
ncbi:uncharacterized protein LOC129981481 [Argiope bruennichi]|uniref:uncharacterized protein LOC129981481 n=1 Tax=Argiope bruennichi TaxID=94029 RepID=UPI0024950702|nr:uncharacterized protein LOC129981481 [Argiope bruennichi]